MNIITQDGFKTHSSFQVWEYLKQNTCIYIYIYIYNYIYTHKILENSGRIKGVSFTSDAMSFLIGGNIMTLTNGNSDIIHATGHKTVYVIH